MIFSVKESTLLAFDYGTHNTGVALGRLGLSTPLTIIPTKKKLPDKASIDKLIDLWQPHRFIVGIPVGEIDITDKAMRFANWLEKSYALPAELLDESYSSCVIERKLGEKIDDKSAALLLNQWYNQVEKKQSRYS